MLNNSLNNDSQIGTSGSESIYTTRRSWNNKRYSSVTHSNQTSTCQSYVSTPLISYIEGDNSCTLDSGEWSSSAFGISAESWLITSSVSAVFGTVNLALLYHTNLALLYHYHHQGRIKVSCCKIYVPTWNECCLQKYQAQVKWKWHFSTNSGPSNSTVVLSFSSSRPGTASCPCSATYRLSKSIYFPRSTKGLDGQANFENQN